MIEFKFLLFLLIFSLPSDGNSQTNIEHFIFFSRDRELIHDSTFYSNPGIAGAQITYAWKLLEPEKESYDFSEIEEDLNFLKAKNKKLFIQIQDVTFNKKRNLTPNYMRSDPIYHGGSSPQYWENDKGNLEIGGWVARRWDSSVSDQYRKLLKALGKQFDGRIAGINMPETAIDVSDAQGFNPSGYTDSIYIEEIKKNMWVLRTSFKKSTPLLYDNFLPGNLKSNLDKLYDYALEIKHGMGGPDIKVYRKGQMENSYPLIRKMAGKAPTGVAVQFGNYSINNPKTGKQVTVSEILDFAQNYLQLDYIFWCNEEPFYSKEVLSILHSFKK
jgi:hypothetical protein